jgi:hypothetical protein
MFSRNFYRKGTPMMRLGKAEILKTFFFSSLIISLLACGPPPLTYYHDPDMDFGALRIVAVMPFQNLTSDKIAGARVRDIFANSLMATGAVYVVPVGEVARGINRAGILDPAQPSEEEIARFASIVKVDATITGALTEYGEVRSGASSANIISLSVQMMEVQTRKVVWTASTTQGGITIWDRLFGSGGRPMNDVTMAAVDDLLNKLFR